MGIIAIRIYGSFKNHCDEVFCAEEGGHANALARAINLLADMLSEEIRHDHLLRNDGISPRTEWGVPKK